MVWKKNRKLTKFIKVILFLIILLSCILIINNVLKWKDGYEKSRDFFEQTEDFDVLFMGSSHMMNAVFPMDLWKDFGIVSYNIANGGEQTGSTYYNMLLALKYTRPKLIVLDTYTLFEERKVC